jgi:hypothetical protein
MPLYGYNRPGTKISEGVRNSFWLQGMMAGFPAMRETCHDLIGPKRNGKRAPNLTRAKNKSNFASVVPCQ